MPTADFSFDIVSRADMMEVKNAIDQAQKELHNRYDLKGTKCAIEVDKDGHTLIADDEFRMNQLKDIVFSKLLKRGIDARQIDWGKLEPGAGISVKSKLTFKVGIAQDKARALVKQIKDKGLKVNAQIQGEEVRVSAKVKDDLQKTIQFVKSLDLDYPVSFVNYR
ncbi:MAG TPA: YajQ family cyclic di-GMP-binding protein [Fimbriimonadaceae bacterium]|nr:YajQ family cyclic di-GMP-binding protein [Fimbriimonadaceae bacterium]